MSSGADRHALRGSGRVLIGTLAGRAVQFAALFSFYALAARALPMQAFGAFMLGLTLVQLAAALARRGLDQALLAAARPRALRGFASRKVAAAAVAIGLSAAVVLFAAGAADAASLLLCFALLPVALAQLAFGALRAEGAIAQGNLAEALQPLAAVALGVAAWRIATPAAFASAWMLSWCVSLGYSWLRLRRYPAAQTLRDHGAPAPSRAMQEETKLPERGHAPDSAAAQRTLLAAGGSMAGVYLLGQIAAAADAVLLGLFASVTEVARYAPAQKIAGAFALLHSAFAVAAGPMARRYVHDRALLQRYLRMLARLGTALALPVAVATLGVPGWLPSLFGETYAAHSGAVLQWLALAALSYLVTGPLGNALLCAGHAATLLRITAFGTALLIALVALLAAGGAERAAQGVLLATVAARSVLAYVTWRRLGVHPFGRALLPLLAAGMASVLLVRALAAAQVGTLAANAAGMALAAMIAAAVLARTHDLAFLRDELARRATG